MRKASNQRFQGEGKIGCSVGISLVAPFAVVTLDQMEVFENGSRSEVGIEPHIFDLDGQKVDLEQHYREMVDDEGFGGSSEDLHRGCPCAE